MHDPASFAGCPVDGRPWGEAIHATAVAIAGSGLLIVGPSRSGKSRLAFQLICTARSGDVRLIGDDRVLLTPSPGGWAVRPHPRIAGFIERRGLGILACAFVALAPVHGIIQLDVSPRDDGSTTVSTGLGQNFSNVPVVTISATRLVDAQCADVRSWARRLDHTRSKSAETHVVRRESLELVTPKRSYIGAAERFGATEEFYL